MKLVLEEIPNLSSVQLKYILWKNAFHDAKDDCNTSRIVSEVFTEGPQYKHKKEEEIEVEILVRQTKI